MDTFARGQAAVGPADVLETFIAVFVPLSGEGCSSLILELLLLRLCMQAGYLQLHTFMSSPYIILAITWISMQTYMGKGAAILFARVKSRTSRRRVLIVGREVCLLRA